METSILAVEGFDLIPRSVQSANGLNLALVTQGQQRLLAVSGPDLAEFEGYAVERAAQTVLLGPLSPHNAAALRRKVAWLRPQLLGLQRSAGLGDRLGLATPGHVRAIRAVGGAATMWAQQSIREMARTGRTAQQVQDDALWGVLAEGWTEGFGADADHLKTFADIDVCAAAGFTFFTIDPGAFVDNQADSDSLAELLQKVERIDWAALESTPQEQLQAYAGKTFDLESLKVTFQAETLWRAVVKYGQAVAHIAHMYRYLQGKGIPFELEISVDETETPTTHAEHIWIARSLQRLGVKWVSLAPRFVGRFEKGVEFQGSLAELALDLKGHAEIARVFGPYKLSLHSGSDKFSVYPLLAQASRGLAHLKTAGTSYLEALRVIAAVQPDFFREILDLARRHYESDRASYHVSARLEKVPQAAGLADAELPALLDQFDTRQALHVTFGTALAQVGGQLKATLLAHPEAYAVDLQAHFERHLRPFVG